MFWQGFVSNIVDPMLFLLCTVSFGKRMTFSGIIMVPILREVPKPHYVWHGLFLLFRVAYQGSSLPFSFSHSNTNPAISHRCNWEQPRIADI